MERRIEPAQHAIARGGRIAHRILTDAFEHPLSSALCGFIPKRGWGRVSRWHLSGWPRCVRCEEIEASA